MVANHPCTAKQTAPMSLGVQACPAVDLVIRTSGESRLSDFLLLQSSTAYLHFVDALWPAFSFLDMLDAFTSYQRVATTLASLRTSCSNADIAVHVGAAGYSVPCYSSGRAAGQKCCGCKPMCMCGGAMSEGFADSRGCKLCRGTSLCKAL